MSAITRIMPVTNVKNEKESRSSRRSRATVQLNPARGVNDGTAIGRQIKRNSSGKECREETEN